jgi:hypothetical protein
MRTFASLSDEDYDAFISYVVPTFASPSLLTEAHLKHFREIFLT